MFVGRKIDYVIPFGVGEFPKSLRRVRYKPYSRTTDSQINIVRSKLHCTDEGRSHWFWFTQRSQIHSVFIIMYSYKPCRTDEESPANEVGSPHCQYSSKEVCSTHILLMTFLLRQQLGNKVELLVSF